MPKPKKESQTITLREAAKYLDAQAYYIIKPRDTDVVIKFPVTIVDAKMGFGRVDFGYIPTGGTVENSYCAWASFANIELPGRTDA